MQAIFHGRAESYTNLFRHTNDVLPKKQVFKDSEGREAGG